MRSRSLATDHDAAVARRLELLTSELAAVRDDSARAARRRGSRSGRARIRAVPDPEPDRDARAATRTQRTTAAASGGADAGAPRLPPDHGRAGGWVAARCPSRSVGGWVWGPGSWPSSPCWPWWGWWPPAGSWSAAAARRSRRRWPCRRPPQRWPAGGRRRPGRSGGERAPTAPASKVVVDVAGKVRRPGIAVLRSGARVVDAIRAAGGARPRGRPRRPQPRAGADRRGADRGRRPGRSRPTGVAAAASGAPPAAGLVDLNTADQTALESLPEVGPVTAQAIIAWRDRARRVQCGEPAARRRRDR